MQYLNATRCAAVPCRLHGKRLRAGGLFLILHFMFMFRESAVVFALCSWTLLFLDELHFFNVCGNELKTSNLVILQSATYQSFEGMVHRGFQSRLWCVCVCVRALARARARTRHAHARDDLFTVGACACARVCVCVCVYFFFLK